MVSSAQLGGNATKCRHSCCCCRCRSIRTITAVAAVDYERQQIDEMKLQINIQHTHVSIYICMFVCSVVQTFRETRNY